MTTDKTLFAAYAETAGLKDLESYVTYAQRHRDEYTTETRAIVGEMIALLDTFYERPHGSAASRKRAAWTLIQRFKSSIAGWYGSAGASQTVEQECIASAVALWVTHGAWAVLLDPKTPVIEATVVAQSTEQSVDETPKAPTWRARALLAEAQIKELEARLRNTEAPSPKAQMPVRVPRPARVNAPGIDGQKTCRDCAETKPMQEFAWAAHGGIRSICRTCRRAQGARRLTHAA